MANYLNIFSIHYFLWFGGQTAIFGYIDDYSKTYANTKPNHFGLLNMVLPFVGIVTKMLFCSLADRHKAHRQFFLFFIITALLGYACLTSLPFFASPQPVELGINLNVWVTICICWSLTSISLSVISSLSDMFAMNSSRKNNTSYGHIRLWGTLGWGVSSLLLANINSTNKLPFLVPGLIMTLCLVTLDVVLIFFWPDRDDFRPTRPASGHVEDNPESGESGSNRIANDTTSQVNGLNRQTRNDYGAISDTKDEKDPDVSNDSEQESFKEISSIKVQWLLFKEVVRRRKSIFRYMILFVISGALISLQWSFLFRFLHETYPENFEFVSGISMVIQSMLGELPFFIFSDWMVKKMGRSNALGFSIMTIGIRYMLYSYVLVKNSSYYLVLLTEPFAGPNFGLFYVVMTEVGLDYSDCEAAVQKVTEDGHVRSDTKTAQKLRQALRATMQSLMSACYEGLGVGIGSIIGGLAIVHYGFHNLWLWSGILALVLGSLVIIADHLKVPFIADDDLRHS